MSEPEKEDDLFALLVNISVSNETTLERLNTGLKVFVRKYFENFDISEPSNPFEIVSNCILKSEAIIYTVFELEKKAYTEEEKIELLSYKDIVLKTLVVITSLDFFVRVLKDFGLYKDAYMLKEKLTNEFKLESNKLGKLQQNLNLTEILLKAETLKKFKYVKPAEHQKLRGEIDKKPTPTTSLYESDEEIMKRINDEKFGALNKLKNKLVEAQKLNLERPKFEPKKDKNGNTVVRTATGWQIPTELLEKGLYSDLIKD